MSSRTQRQKPTQVCGAFVAETKTQERVNESLLNNVNHDYICFGVFFVWFFFCDKTNMTNLCGQSFKRKPGRADNERSLGDASERVHKRLRTVESAELREQEHAPDDGPRESDTYEHVRHGEEKYDTQTYGEHTCIYTYVFKHVSGFQSRILSAAITEHRYHTFIQYHVFIGVDTASAEQQRPTSTKQDDDDDDDVAMDTEVEKEMQAADTLELKPEKPDSSKASKGVLFGSVVLFFTMKSEYSVDFRNRFQFITVNILLRRRRFHHSNRTNIRLFLCLCFVCFFFLSSIIFSRYGQRRSGHLEA